MGVRDDDEPLDALHHDGLVAHLNRLYADAGERPLSASAAKASTDAELRERIEMVRRRQAQRKAAPPPRSSANRGALDRRGGSVGTSGGGGGGSDRVLCVLLTPDGATANAARALMRARGVPLVLATTPDALARVLASVTPTHLVIDGALDEGAVRRQLGARATDVCVYWSEGEEATIAALAIVT